MIDYRAKTVCQQIVQIFEVGRIDGGYDNVTVIPGDSGGLTYGKYQTTLATGNLYLMLNTYVMKDNSQDDAVKDLKNYLPRIKKRDMSLNHNYRLIQLLKYLGEDPVMQMVQDEFFDRAYWKPAEKTFHLLMLECPLSMAVVFDSFVHGSFNRVRKLFPEVPPVKGGNEKLWTRAYVNRRRRWFLENTLGGKPYKADDPCVYRMDAFINLITANNWELQTPFYVRGIKLT